MLIKQNILHDLMLFFRSQVLGLHHNSFFFFPSKIKVILASYNLRVFFLFFLFLNIVIRQLDLVYMRTRAHTDIHITF